MADAVAADGAPRPEAWARDLRDPATAAELAARLRREPGHLDILIGNAATVGDAVAGRDQTPAAFREVMALNLDANQALLHALDPLLRAAPAGRAVFTTSGLARRPFPHLAAYCASKAALEVLVTCHARDTEATAVRANLLDPGVVATDLFRAAMPAADTSGMKGPAEIADAFLALVRPDVTRTGEIVSWKTLAAS